MLPFLSAMGDISVVERQRERLRVAASNAGLGESTNDYDQAPILFGEGWLDRQYAFDGDGHRTTPWAS